MDATYLLACGIVWHRCADEEAGGELVRALGDPDPDVRFLAQELLLAAGPPSMALLEEAISSGTLGADDAAPCMLALLADRAQSSYALYSAEQAGTAGAS